MSDPSNSTVSGSFAKGGTTRWMSPELLAPDEYGFEDSRPTKESDCYALGMVVYEVLTGKVPFASYRGWVVIRNVIKGEKPPRPEERGVCLFSDELWSILEHCWNALPSDRPSVEKVLQCLDKASSSWIPPSPIINKDVEAVDDTWRLTTANNSSGNVRYLIFSLAFCTDYAPVCSNSANRPPTSIGAQITGGYRVCRLADRDP